MEVFLIARRKNQSIFLDVKEETTVKEVKAMISGITMEQPEDMVLYLDEKTMSDNKTMADYNLNHVTARATSPIVIVVCFRDPASGKFEQPDVTPLSVPPELPDAMKPTTEVIGGSEN